MSFSKMLTLKNAAIGIILLTLIQFLPDLCPRKQPPAAVCNLSKELLQRLRSILPRKSRRSSLNSGVPSPFFADSGCSHEPFGSAPFYHHDPHLFFKNCGRIVPSANRVRRPASTAQPGHQRSGFYAQPFCDVSYGGAYV